ncbi:AMP-binding protein [Georgenia sp. MJ206]|uniref:AMP-binding protein n=1 Tax=Georgenia wangjunii TaxID=3117730 RepID=UPI002F264CD4
MTTHAPRPGQSPSLPRAARPVPAGTRPVDVHALLSALAGVLGSPGAAPLAPYDPASPAPVPVRAGAPAPAGTAVVVRTSGSTTGSGHLVALSGDALRASALATHEHLAGPGQWLACLPSQHIAGLQVLVRSLVAGTEPVVLDTTTGFTPEALAAAVATMRTDVPTYASLVPTQLRRVLDAGPGAVEPLRGLAALLLGGARTPDSLLARARAAGLRVRTTYGMTETAGGCVYDGVPLPGVRVRTGADGRVLLAGPMLATGYLDDPAAHARTFVTDGGERWLRTADVGILTPGADGRARLLVEGRLDDVIITGGLNVSPAAVEQALGDVPGVAESVVVGVPDEQWSALVVAVVTTAPSGPAPRLDAVRDAVGARLGRHHAPRALVVLDALPSRGPGKTDRRAATTIAATALAGHTGPGADLTAPQARVVAVERLG